MLLVFDLFLIQSGQNIYIYIYMEVLTNHIVPLDLSPVGLIVGMENKSSSTFVLSLGQTTSKNDMRIFFSDGFPYIIRWYLRTTDFC